MSRKERKKVGKMFKTKLQELCHQKRWALPMYSCMRDGEDHNPQFKASVVINGTNFNSPSICKSLKESQNEVAKLAFLHFTSGVKAEQTQKASHTTSTDLSVEADYNATYGISKTEQAQRVSDSNANASSTGDVQQEYKLKLKKYSERKKLNLPIYHVKSMVQSGTLCFRAIVTLGGDSFESSRFYETKENAEDAAAHAALVSLIKDTFREGNVSLYKNKLQELATETDCFMPEYKILKYGHTCSPLFFSTIEVERQLFNGNPAKSKKHVELSAARIAYSSSMQPSEKSCCKNDNSSSSSKDEPPELAHALKSLTFHDQLSNSKLGSPSISTSCKEFVPQDEENKDSSRMTRVESTTYLLCNRIKVYTCIPDITFKKGNVLLPIGEGKWVVVNMEFPQNKDS